MPPGSMNGVADDSLARKLLNWEPDAVATTLEGSLAER
jgi:hypothetical protein